MQRQRYTTCLLYTSDAADERSSVDLGGRRIIKKKKKHSRTRRRINSQKYHTIALNTPRYQQVNKKRQDK